ncbi:unnamed protein product, partial [Mesorhabditis spiculigera]
MATKVFKHFHADRRVAHWVGRVRAACFLPADKIEQLGVFSIPHSVTHAEPALHAAASAFADYLRNTWLIRFRSMFVHHDSLRHRTTNFSESFHNTLRSLLGQIPSIGKFYERIRELFFKWSVEAANLTRPNPVLKAATIRGHRERRLDQDTECLAVMTLANRLKINTQGNTSTQETQIRLTDVLQLGSFMLQVAMHLQR